MNTKTILLIFIAMFRLFVPVSGQWQQIYSPKNIGAKITKYKGKYLNLTSDGLYQTTNQGSTWEAIPVDIDDSHLFAINPYNNYWYKAISNTLFESVDEGASWTNLNIAPYLYNILKLQFSKDTVFALGNYNHRLVKKNGVDWKIILDSGEQFGSFAVKDSVIFIATYSNGVSISKDYGQTFNLLFWHSSEYCGIASKGDTLLCIFNSPGFVYRSFDFGLTWASANLPANILMNNIFINEEFYWVNTSLPSPLYYSSDGLTNWQPLLLPAEFYGDNQVFQDGNMIFTSTNLGLLRSFDLGQTWDLSNNTIGKCPGYRMSYLDGNVLIPCFSYLEEGDNIWKMPMPVRCKGNIVHWNDRYLSGSYTSHENIGFAQWQPTQSTIPDFNPVIIDSILSCEYNEHLHQSFDNGATWQQTIVKRPDFSHLPIVGQGNKLWAAGQDWHVAVFRYDTLGENWPHDGLWEIGSNCSFFNYRDTIYLFTKAGTLQYSTDAGLSVITANKPADFVSSGAVGKQLFVRDKFMIITTIQGTFYVSKDRGQSWVKLPEPPYPGAANEFNVPTAGDHFLYTSTDNGIFAYPLDSLQINKGWVFFDLNSNGVQDTGELGLENIKVLNTGSQDFTFTDAQGTFRLTGLKTQDSLKVAALPSGFSSVPAAVAFQNIGVPVLFAIQPQFSFKNVSIELIQGSNFRPGFETNITVIVNNLGTLPADATVSITLPSDLEVISFSPGNGTVLANTITWTLTQLAPLDNALIHLVVKTNWAVLAGTALEIVAQTSLPGDIDPINNVYTLNDLVVSSYDPNDKLVSPAKLTPPDLIEISLTYTIRFQNTGTAATEFVYIKDTISPLLDLSTLKLIGSSHPVQVKFEENRLVTFVFSPLHLVPQAESETGSQGFVRFAIQPRPDLLVGEIIQNTAYIYFDYNPEIITNTAGAEIKAVSTHEITVLPLDISPNPGDISSTVRIPLSASGILYMYQADGQQILKQTTTTSEAIISCQHLQSGIYIVHWKAGKQLFVGKLVVSH
jgi:photosystem II stability/assembly factor-like uncharacterized protein